MTEGLRLEVVDRVATVTLDRPETEEPAHLRALRGAARLVPRRRRRARASGRSCSPAPAATSAPAATCTRSSARWSAARCRELLAFTRMTGDLVEGDAQLPAADRRRRRRRLRRRRRDPRHGLRPPPRDARREDGVPVHARRPRRLRHGRLRDPAAHHRPGPRRRAAATPALDGRRRGRAVGLLQPARRRPTSCSARRRRWPAALAHGPTFAHAMTKTMLTQEWAMGVDEAIEAEAQAQAICMQTARLRARLPRLRGKRDDRSSRATDMADRSFLTWPFFDDRHRALTDELDAFGAGLGAARPRRRRRRRDLPRARRAPRPSRGPACGLQRRARRALALPRPRDAGLPRRPRRLRVRDAGPRLRRDLAVRHGRAEGRAPAARRRRRGDRRASRCPSRRPAPTSPRSRPPRAATATATCIDGDKTWISNGGIADVYIVFARTGEAPGARGLSAFLVDADTPGLRIAERIDVDRAASAGDARLRGLPRPGRPPDRRAGRRLQGRDGDARRLPLHGRRGGARLRAPRARRDARPRQLARAVRRAARRPAADAGEARRHGARDRRRRAARLPRRLDEGRRARRASPARRRWRSCTPPRPRSASSTRPCSCTAASA